MYCFKNGEILASEQSGFSVGDLGILRGYGIFDFLRTYHGVPFRLAPHLARLERSAAMVGLTVPYNQKILTEAISTLLKKNGFAESNIKIIVTGGPSSDGISVEHPTVVITVTPAQPVDPQLYKSGITLLLEEYQRDFVQAKTISYLKAASLQQKKREVGAYEILYTVGGMLLECATSNIFIITKGKLRTAKNNILAGITRDVVLEIAPDICPVVVEDIPLADVYTADEVFITASNKEVLPVVGIDGKVVGGGKVGTLTRRLYERYHEVIALECKTH